MKCYNCGKAEMREEVIETCPNCNASCYPLSAIRATNTPIEDLIKEYEEEDCDFSDINELVKIALIYSDTMGDSHVRCILYKLAKNMEGYSSG